MPEQDHLIAAILTAGLLSNRPISHPERDRKAGAKLAVGLYRECLNEMGLGEQHEGD
ncbi:MAG: hypothetical protein V3U34_08190 [candidate division NC10 bacterium]